MFRFFVVSILLVAAVSTEAADRTKLKLEGCSFPFVYRGKSYDYCIKHNAQRYWCSINDVYDGTFYYCEEEVVQVDDNKDKFNDVFNKLKENSQTIRALEQIIKDSKTPRCGCQDEINILAKAINETTTIVVDHERRIRGGDNLGKTVKEIGKKMKSVDKHWEKVVATVVVDEKKNETQCQSGGDCYTFIREKKTFGDAEKHCESLGGHLVSIHDSDTNVWISSQMGDFGISSGWIGLNDPTKDGNFEWTDKSTYNYGSFQAGEPDNANNEESCVDTNLGGKWNDVSCNLKHAFVCEKSAPKESEDAKEKRICRCGNICYDFITDSMSYTDADKHCMQKGGRLASIHSANENEWIARAAKKIDIKGLWWIGMNDIAEEDCFENTDQTPVSFQNWATGDPNNAGNEDCVQFGWEKAKYSLWTDYKCHLKQNFVCKSGPYIPAPKRKLEGEHKCEKGNCYVFMSEALAYDDAARSCRKAGGSLASARTLVDQKTLKNMIVSINGGEFQVAKQGSFCKAIVKSKIQNVLCFNKMPYVCAVPDVSTGPYCY